MILRPQSVIDADRLTREQLLEKQDSQPSALLARLLDATCLAVGTTHGDIEDLCAAALRDGVRAVCVPTVYLKELPISELKRAEIEVATVINFPNGFAKAETAQFETERAIRDGATEIDFVQPIYAVKNRDWRAVEEFSRQLIASFPGFVFKVILETGLLSITELQTSVRCHAMAGAHIIKTCTGFGPRGASVADIQTIRNTLQAMGMGAGIGIKASGKISTRQAALELVAAGATRIGTSKSSVLLQEG